MCESFPSGSWVCCSLQVPYLEADESAPAIPALSSWEVLLGRAQAREGPALRKRELLHTSLSQARNADKFSKAQPLPASFQHLPWCAVGQLGRGSFLPFSFIPAYFPGEKCLVGFKSLQLGSWDPAP